MKKESNWNRTRRTAVALALLLAFAAPRALRGNLGIYAPTCGGCGECPACTADKDSGADGPSGFSWLLDLIRGYVASVLEPPRIFNNITIIDIMMLILEDGYLETQLVKSRVCYCMVC